MVDEFTTDVSWEARTPQPARRSSLSQFVKDYKNEASRVTESKNSHLVEAFVETSKKLLHRLWEMTKQAIEYAASKFLVELCAMIIAAVGAALTKKHGKSVEISTGDVHYRPNAQPQQSSGQQGNLWGHEHDSRSPFDSGWTRTGTGSW
jgi:hypothetical protein